MPGSTSPHLIPYLMATDDLASLDEHSLSLATRLQALIPRRGERSGTTNGSGEITVNHQCGFPPTAIHLTGHTGAGAPILRVKGTPTDTQFTVEYREGTTGALVTNTAVTFYWTAYAA